MVLPQTIDNPGAGAGSGDGQFAEQVEIVYSQVASSTYPTSSMRYVPIEKVAAPNEEYVQLQFKASKTGRLMVDVGYAMSVDDAGDVVLDYFYLLAGDGDSPNGALVAGDTLTFTPGAGQTAKTLEIDSGLDVTEGDNVIFRIVRADDAADDHPGSWNLMNMLVRVA